MHRWRGLVSETAQREDELGGAPTCPPNPGTQDLIDAGALAAMKPTALLVNVARGKVVHEPALVVWRGETELKNGFV